MGGKRSGPEGMCGKGGREGGREGGATRVGIPSIEGSDSGFGR
jgi:hypothetical protein